MASFNLTISDQTFVRLARKFFGKGMSEDEIISYLLDINEAYEEQEKHKND